MHMQAKYLSQKYLQKKLKGKAFKKKYMQSKYMQKKLKGKACEKKYMKSKNLRQVYEVKYICSKS